MTSEREQEGGSPPQAMLTVAAVARRLGVAPSTLRTWDRRYGLGPSAHTAGSHRRYSPDDVSRLTVMRGLVMEGVPPAEAAQIALGTPVETDREPDDQPGASGATGLPSADVRPGVATQPVVALPVAPRPLHADPVAPPARPMIVPVSRRSYPPDAAGAAAWPVTPLAARHLIQASAPEDVARAGGAPSPAGGSDPRSDLDAARGPFAVTDLDESLGVGLDEVLAQVIDQALGRPDTAATTSLWPGGRSSVGARIGGGRVISLPDASPRARGLARAAMSLDTHELTRLLRDAVGAYGVIGTWNTMILPVLQGLGDRWRATGDGVDVEHAFSEATLGVLRVVTGTLYRPRNVRPVLLACADGDYHALPLHVLAAALAEAEVGCRVLGAGLPAPALVAAARRSGPAVVLVYAQLPVTDGSVLRELPRQRPAPRVIVGGPGWESADVPASALRVGSLQSAVDEVLAAVRP